MKRGQYIQSNTSFTYLPEVLSDEPGLDLVEETVMENGATYTGQLKEGRRHGYGIQVWPDGKKYMGYWRNDLQHGKGRMRYIDGDLYDGKIYY